MRPIRVVVVDDHELYRGAIVSALRSQGEVEVIGEAGSGHDGIAMAVEAGPDVVLLDMDMPDISGLDVAREIRRRLPRASIVMLTINDGQGYLTEARLAGAAGYVLKDAGVRQVLDAIRAATRGEAYADQASSKRRGPIGTGARSRRRQAGSHRRGR